MRQKTPAFQGTCDPEVCPLYLSLKVRGFENKARLTLGEGSRREMPASLGPSWPGVHGWLGQGKRSPNYPQASGRAGVVRRGNGTASCAGTCGAGSAAQGKGRVSGVF